MKVVPAVDVRVASGITPIDRDDSKPFLQVKFGALTGVESDVVDTIVVGHHRSQKCPSRVIRTVQRQSCYRTRLRDYMVSTSGSGFVGSFRWAC
jgi:hypothetical protein